MKQGMSALLLFLLGITAMTGCMRNQRQIVVAATGTSIGLEVAQNPASQSPEMKFGYQRAEVAIVPTNRSGFANPETSHGSGATDAPDVLMELWYRHLLREKAGVYQRLAVGSTAVSQPGAAFLFAREANGELTEEGAAAVQGAFAAVAGAKSAPVGVLDKIARLYIKLDDSKKADANQKIREIASARTDNRTKYQDVLQLVREGHNDPNQDLLETMLREVEKIHGGSQ